MVWLLRRLKPDTKMIADFRRTKRSAIRQVFRDFMVLSRERNFNRARLTKAMAESDKRLARYVWQLDDADKDDEDGDRLAVSRGRQSRRAAKPVALHVSGSAFWGLFRQGAR